MTEKTKTIYDRLAEIQQSLKAPKGQFNDFAKFSYRSCEDILEAIKPLLKGLVLILDDEIVQAGERYYVKAVAKLSDGKDTIIAKAYAREAFDKKGMDDSQITGTASSYARKYALNGLFAIDDTKDADSQKPAQGEAATHETKSTMEEFDKKQGDQDKCEHKMFKILVVSKDGPNKGKKFKSCVNCGKFMGFINETHKEGIPLPGPDGKIG